MSNPLPICDRFPTLWFVNTYKDLYHRTGQAQCDRQILLNTESRLLF
ncbi:hypothetical protein [Laspinema palackyanum]|nr:hypothetical protein [Laspinema sp. D2c]